MYSLRRVGELDGDRREKYEFLKSVVGELTPSARMLFYQPSFRRYYLTDLSLDEVIIRTAETSAKPDVWFVAGQEISSNFRRAEEYPNELSSGMLAQQFLIDDTIFKIAEQVPDLDTLISLWKSNTKLKKYIEQTKILLYFRDKFGIQKPVISLENLVVEYAKLYPTKHCKNEDCLIIAIKANDFELTNYHFNSFLFKYFKHARSIEMAVVLANEMLKAIEDCRAGGYYLSDNLVINVPHLTPDGKFNLELYDYVTQKIKPVFTAQKDIRIIFNNTDALVAALDQDIPLADTQQLGPSVYTEHVGLNNPIPVLNIKYLAALASNHHGMLLRLLESGLIHLPDIETDESIIDVNINSRSSEEDTIRLIKYFIDNRGYVVTNTNLSFAVAKAKLRVANYLIEQLGSNAVMTPIGVNANVTIETANHIIDLYMKYTPKDLLFQALSKFAEAWLINAYDDITIIKRILDINDNIVFSLEDDVGDNMRVLGYIIARKARSRYLGNREPYYIKLLKHYIEVFSE